MPKNIAVITGASGGLGREFVRLFTKDDSIQEIWAVARKKDKLEKLQKEFGSKIRIFSYDLSDIEQIEIFTKEYTKGSIHISYLVNNAGNASGMGFLNATEAEFDALYRIHVKSVFFLSQKLLPLLADGGRIVNVSSGLTRIVMANQAPYAIMKSAVETLTRYMAFELGSRGITVNCVAPGAIATDFSGGVVRDNPQVAQAVANMTALGRPGLPEDIGPMIASLLSDDHRWVNAQRIEVSGGMRI